MLRCVAEESYEMTDKLTYVKWQTLSFNTTVVVIWKMQQTTYTWASCGDYDPLRASGNYTNHLLYQLTTLHYVFMCFVWFSEKTVIISLNSSNQLIFVMVKWGVLFEVRTEFLNIIYTASKG
jgi:hypothetical protein